jgi:exodeoxyribonuclease VIII
MVDLETMGKGPRAAVCSIGAVPFSADGIGPGFEAWADLGSAVALGLEMDASTVAFWLGQPGELRGSLVTTASAPLPDCLRAFADWCKATLADDFCIWGNGATFDNVILASAFDAAGIARPWSYRQNRCYRTLHALFPDVAFEPTAKAHSAIDDARAQAAHASKLLQLVTHDP